MPETSLQSWEFRKEEILNSPRKVKGIFHQPTIDKDGEFITADAIRKSIPDFMNFPVLHDFHKERPVGLVTKICELPGERFYFEGVLKSTTDVDDVWEKVSKGNYDQVSIFGKRTKYNNQCSLPQNMRSGPCVTDGVRLDSISVCDMNARNPETSLEVKKAKVLFDAEELVKAPPVPSSGGFSLSALVKAKVAKAETTSSNLQHASTDYAEEKDFEKGLYDRIPTSHEGGSIHGLSKIVSKKNRDMGTKLKDTSYAQSVRKVRSDPEYGKKITDEKKCKVCHNEEPNTISKEVEKGRTDRIPSKRVGISTHESNKLVSMRYGKELIDSPLKHATSGMRRADAAHEHFSGEDERASAMEGMKNLHKAEGEYGHITEKDSDESPTVRFKSPKKKESPPGMKDIHERGIKHSKPSPITPEKRPGETGKVYRGVERTAATEGGSKTTHTPRTNPVGEKGKAPEKDWVKIRERTQVATKRMEEEAEAGHGKMLKQFKEGSFKPDYNSEKRKRGAKVTFRSRKATESEARAPETKEQGSATSRESARSAGQQHEASTSNWERKHMEKAGKRPTIEEEKAPESARSTSQPVNKKIEKEGIRPKSQGEDHHGGKLEKGKAENAKPLEITERDERGDALAQHYIGHGRSSLERKTAEGGKTMRKHPRPAGEFDKANEGNEEDQEAAEDIQEGTYEGDDYEHAKKTDKDGRWSKKKDPNGTVNMKKAGYQKDPDGSQIVPKGSGQAKPTQDDEDDEPIMESQLEEGIEPNKQNKGKGVPSEDETEVEEEEENDEEIVGKDVEKSYSGKTSHEGKGVETKKKRIASKDAKRLGFDKEKEEEGAEALGKMQKGDEDTSESFAQVSKGEPMEDEQDNDVEYVTKALVPIEEIDTIVKARTEEISKAYMGQLEEIKKAYDGKIAELAAKVDKMADETIRKGGSVVVIPELLGGTDAARQSNADAIARMQAGQR